MHSPTWLTQSYLETVLRNFKQNETVKIISLDVAPMSLKGENFFSTLTRLCVRYTSQGVCENSEINLIVKSCFDNESKIRKRVQNFGLFQREIQIYEKVLPQLHELLNDELQDSDKLCGTLLHASHEHQALIFEDLQSLGYQMLSRTRGLDVEHMQLIMRKLAKLHATSAVLNERQANCLQQYDRGFFNNYKHNYASYYIQMLEACCAYLQQLPELAHYAEKLLALKLNYMDLGRRCTTPVPNQLNVFAHGDIWTNNVMFKYNCENGKPIDVILIDFQHSFWTSPAIDLHLLFNTSLQEELRLPAQHGLCQYYHSIFSETLRKLNYRSRPIPTLHQFSVHMESKRFYGMHASILIQPVMINESTQDADCEALVLDDARGRRYKRNIYENPRVQENLHKLLPIYERRGLLEMNQFD